MTTYKYTKLIRSYLRPTAGFRIPAKLLSSYSQNGYHLLASVCLERKPVISCDLTPLEDQFSEMLSNLELGNSLLNDHEVRHAQEEKRRKRFASGTATESDLEAASIQTAQDFEDAATEMFQKFKPASRTTLADEQNDRKSLNRALQTHLLLLIKCKPTGYLGTFGDWQLPCTEHRNGETLRQTAERALTERCGTDIEATFFGNAPVGLYRCKYPKKYIKDGFQGAKVFFFRAHYKKGQVKTLDSTEDYYWVTRNELDEKLTPNPLYLKALKAFTIDDRFKYMPQNRLVIKYFSNIRSKMSQ